MARNPRPDNGEKRKLMTFAAGYVIAAAALRAGTTSGGSNRPRVPPGREAARV